MSVNNELHCNEWSFGSNYHTSKKHLYILILTSRFVALGSGDCVARFFLKSRLSPFTKFKNSIPGIRKLNRDIATERPDTSPVHTIAYRYIPTSL